MKFTEEELKKAGLSFVCDNCKRSYPTKQESQDCFCRKIYTKEQLNNWYEKGGVLLIMERLEVSRPTAFKVLDRAGVPRNKKRGNPKKKKKVYVKGVDCE
jgi:hypothetical protein